MHQILTLFGHFWFDAFIFIFASQTHLHSFCMKWLFPSINCVDCRRFQKTNDFGNGIDIYTKIDPKLKVSVNQAYHTIIPHGGETLHLIISLDLNQYAS